MSVNQTLIILDQNFLWKGYGNNAHNNSHKIKIYIMEPDK